MLRFGRYDGALHTAMVRLPGNRQTEDIFSHQRIQLYWFRLMINGRLLAVAVDELTDQLEAFRNQSSQDAVSAMCRQLEHC